MQSRNIDNLYILFFFSLFMSISSIFIYDLWPINTFSLLPCSSHPHLLYVFPIDLQSSFTFYVQRFLSTKFDLFLCILSTPVHCDHFLLSLFCLKPAPVSLKSFIMCSSKHPLPSISYHPTRVLPLVSSSSLPTRRRSVRCGGCSRWPLDQWGSLPTLCCHSLVHIMLMHKR